MKPFLSVDLLCQEAAVSARIESTYPEPSLYGVTDGKAIGTYLEHKFQVGYLTISNALQWRLQYRRVIDVAGKVEGVLKVL
jgi:hypothetical protein